MSIAIVATLLTAFAPSGARGAASATPGTGEAAADQKRFQELAIMLYATIFAKDALLADLAELQQPATDVVGPVPEVDAGLAEFPGMSQKDITADFGALHGQQSGAQLRLRLLRVGGPPRRGH